MPSPVRKTLVHLAIATTFGLSIAACASKGTHNTEDERRTYENQKYYHPNCTHLPEGSATQKQCWADENYKERKERESNREQLKRQSREINDSLQPLNNKKLGL